LITYVTADFSKPQKVLVRIYVWSLLSKDNPAFEGWFKPAEDFRMMAESTVARRTPAPFLLKWALTNVAVKWIAVCFFVVH
jgi:hypothetical protein